MNYLNDKITRSPLYSVFTGALAITLTMLCGLTSVSAGGSGPVLLQGIEAVPRLRITGNVGTLFRIEYSDQLSPAAGWATLQNIILPSDPYYFLDTNAPANSSRFYRITLEHRAPELVWIVPGTYMIGSPIDEKDRLPDEGPQSTVIISKGFWMGKYEVTQAEYLSVMNANPSAFQDDLKRPVDNVNWNDAVTYCAKLTEEERGAGKLPAGYAYRLPSEAEWEYAARAGTSTRFSFGDDMSYTQMDAYCWYGSNSGQTSHPVGSKSPNAWGLYDMHGNVWEWCSDWYSGGYLGGLLGQLDPLGPLLGSDRVIRGGSWKGLNRFCRSASRSSSQPSIPGSNLGFRVVLAQTRP